MGWLEAVGVVIGGCWGGLIGSFWGGWLVVKLLERWL